MKTPIRTFEVAVAGLDLLHHTRLKLACSLLLSERMDVSVRTWPGNAPDLLVTSLDHPDAAAVLADARAAGVRLLRISRRATAVADGLLPHGATVRDFNAQLRTLLGSPTLPAARAAVEDGEEDPVPLLVKLAAADAAPALHLLQRGAMWLLLDTHTRSIALPAGTTLAELCGQLDATSWSARAIDEADFQHQYAYRLPQRQSLETLFFAIAQHRPALLPSPPATLRLRHWPDLAAGDVPTPWLLPIARLHAASWNLDTLAQHCRLPRATMASLFSAASASGLALAQELPVPAAVPRANPADTHFLVRIARRLGLGLLRGHA